MNKISRLVQSYEKYISLPWRNNVASAQRVIFCVYDEKDERFLRAKIVEFEIATQKADHDWSLFDLTDTFGRWLASQKYAKSYYQNPSLLTPLLKNYLQFLLKEFELQLQKNADNENGVVALKGIGTLFGLLKAKELVDLLAPKVRGRLLVFFPGSYENNNYRLLNGYDGWGYLAIPITADKEF